MEIDSSKSAVIDSLRRHEIPIRKAHDQGQRKSQPRYGEKRQHGIIVSHKREQGVLEIIQTLRAEGLALRKICVVLDQMKIKTKARKDKWHPEAVRRCLKVP